MGSASDFQFVLSPLLQVLVDRISKPEFLNLFQGQKYNDQILNKFRSKLVLLQNVLEDAEKEQITNSAMREWLDELQDVLYEADDFLDLINTEALRVKVESRYRGPTNQVSAFRCLSSSSVKFVKGKMRKLEEILQLVENFIQMNDIFGLRKDFVWKKQPFQHPSTSLIHEDTVYGRDADKEKIIKILLSDVKHREKFSVISIVGLGGVGKTTLAQLIYNDKRVNESFDSKAWVCISDEYDLRRITKGLLRGLLIHFESDETLNSLQVKLREGLSGKKFLFILDDIWNRNYSDWNLLSAVFNGGKGGSKIIVTTRDEEVALVMDSRSIYHLDPLSEDACWSLFKKHALNNRDADGNMEFESIGREIVKKYGGLPLGVKAVAGLLRTKVNIKEWAEILKSDELEMIGILPSLELSYHRLSSHLKRCFAYCAVFHEDYRFSKDEVISLWMANGLLGISSSNKSLEDIGDAFFCELIAKFFFRESSDGKFSMPGVVNHLAKILAGKYFYWLEKHPQENGPSCVVRHFSYLSCYADALEKFKHPNELKFLRTFLPLGFTAEEYKRRWLSKKLLLDVLPTIESLRVLSLCDHGITELPNSFANLKLLRFLDLSFTHIKKLPSWICTFYNLQTLLVANCKYLAEFPENMEKLINLRHIDITGVHLSKMPFVIGRLENLHFLSNFIVSGYSGSRIEELGKVSSLRRELTISGLEKVTNGKDASMAEMKRKKLIKQLTLQWNDDNNNSGLAFGVLENLQPHPNIEHLEINGYCGTRLPSWLGDPSFCHMVSLCISNCGNCFCLPAIGQLPLLEHLTLNDINKVVAIGQEFYGDSYVSKPFACLKKMRIGKMEEWREWHIPGNGVFSFLEELYIKDCPKLIGKIPKQLPKLRILKISECPGLTPKQISFLFLNCRSKKCQI